MSLTNFLSNTVAGNLGITWPDLLIVLTLFCVLIFYAMSLRVGLVTSFVALALVYVAFSEWGLPTVHALTLFILLGVIMIASLFISRGRENSGVLG